MLIFFLEVIWLGWVEGLRKYFIVLEMGVGVYFNNKIEFYLKYKN